MHKQFRVVPAASPPDVEKLLRRLKDAKVNLAGAGGSNVEYGGEFAFAVDDGQALVSSVSTVSGVRTSSEKTWAGTPSSPGTPIRTSRMIRPFSRFSAATPAMQACRLPGVFSSQQSVSSGLTLCSKRRYG